MDGPRTKMDALEGVNLVVVKSKTRFILDGLKIDRENGMTSFDVLR